MMCRRGGAPTPRLVMLIEGRRVPRPASAVGAPLARRKSRALCDPGRAGGFLFRQATPASCVTRKTLGRPLMRFNL